MVDYDKLNQPIEEDEPIKVLFQRKINNEFVTYLVVGEFNLSEIRRVLTGLMGMKND